MVQQTLFFRMFPRFVIIIIVLAAIAEGQVPQLEPTITIRSNSPSKDFTGTKQRQGPGKYGGKELFKRKKERKKER